MTLTRLIPTLRASIPDPLDRRIWPADTVATLVDVVVEGVSLLHVAQLSGTPSLLPAPAREDGGVSARVLRVAAVAAHADGEVVILVDGDTDDCGAVWAEARLIGRISTARVRGAVVRPTPPYGTSATRAVAWLPVDVRAGDLIVVPCATVRDVVTGPLESRGPAAEVLAV